MSNVILVTGCSGRVGTLVTERFAQAGFTVVGIDCAEPIKKNRLIDFLKVNLGSDEEVHRGLKIIQSKYGDRIASVIHLAAYYSFSGAHPELYEAITIKGTERLLNGLKSFTTEQFIFSSTQLVYASNPVGQVINEESPIDPKWDYPKSKVKTENLMKAEHGNIPIVMMRIAGCYDDECHSIPIANQIQRIYERQFASHLYPGDLTHGAPFLHLDDLVDAIWLAVQKRSELPHELTLLIGEAKTLSYDELQKAISFELNGNLIKTIEIPKWFAKLGAWVQCQIPGMDSFIQPWMIDIADENFDLDISRAKVLLGWEPTRSLLDTLPKMIRNLKQNPIEWYRSNGLKIPRWLEKKIERNK